MLTVFLPLRGRWPSTKAESNRRDPSGLSGLGIDPFPYRGGGMIRGPSNKQCIFFDESERPTGAVNGSHSVLYSNLSNAIEHVGLDCASKHFVDFSSSLQEEEKKRVFFLLLLLLLWDFSIQKSLAALHTGLL